MTLTWIRASESLPEEGETERKLDDFNAERPMEGDA